MGPFPFSGAFTQYKEITAYPFQTASSQGSIWYFEQKSSGPTGSHSCLHYHSAELTECMCVCLEPRQASFERTYSLLQISQIAEWVFTLDHVSQDMACFEGRKKKFPATLTTCFKQHIFSFLLFLSV